EYVRHRYVSPLQFAEYFKFAFVRNPWDRVVSMYKWHGFHQICSFRSFVAHELTGWLWRNKHWFVRPQCDFVCDDDGRLLVDYVGRYETLQADFDVVCERLGLPPTPLPRVNDNHSGKNQAQSDVRRELKRLASWPWWML